MSDRTGTSPLLQTEQARSTHFRWVICALLFFASTINYIDRQVLGLLAPVLEDEIGWTEAEYGRIVASFTFAYALAFIIFGRVIDKIGTKRGYTLALVWWSVAAMAHALARTPFGFAAARFGLGLGEAGNFPAAVKTVAEWFPRKERALATGIFNGGTNIGAILAPLVVPWLTVTWGWQSAFLVTGAVGLVWVVFWWLLYERPERQRRVNTVELAHITADPPDKGVPVSWGKLLRKRQTWAVALGKGLTDPIWWFYLFWLPKFLDQEFGLRLQGLTLPLVVIYLISDVGSMGGGWLSGFLLKRGWTTNRARKTALLVCALLVTPMLLAGSVTTLWGAVTLVALAAAGHQGWSANIFTTASDMFPRHTVGSVVGIGGFAGAVGGFIFQNVTGEWLEWSEGRDLPLFGDNNYVPLFLVCGLAYLTALLVVHVIVPRLEPVKAA